MRFTCLCEPQKHLRGLRCHKLTYLKDVRILRFVSRRARLGSAACMPSRSLDDNCSAGRPHLCARRARRRRVYTHATCVQRNDANASSEEAVVDVEVDRCMDEKSASNLNYPLFHRSSIDQISRPAGGRFRPHRGRGGWMRRGGPIACNRV